MGTCNGVLSSCALAGFAMESKYVGVPSLLRYSLSDRAFISRCHLGASIIYDTVSNLSWGVDVRTHGIVNVIEKVLNDSWPPAVEVGREVPEAHPEDDCVVRVFPIALCAPLLTRLCACRNATAGSLGTLRRVCDTV
jgi:lipase ATG15